MLEKKVDPAKLVGKILKVKPYQNFPSTIYKNDHGDYELAVRISNRDILGIPLSISPEPRKVIIGQDIFSNYKLLGLIIPFAYSNDNFAADGFEKRKGLFDSETTSRDLDNTSS